MKKRLFPAFVCAGVLILAGCGSKNPVNTPVSDVNNTPDPDSTQTTDNAPSTDNTSSANESKKEYSIWDVMPEIPETDASAFEYEYDSELDGVKVTDYLFESTEVRIPDTLDGKPVVEVDLYECKQAI